jgi:hypothetical protein
MLAALAQHAEGVGVLKVVDHFRVVAVRAHPGVHDSLYPPSSEFQPIPHCFGIHPLITGLDFADVTSHEVCDTERHYEYLFTRSDSCWAAMAKGRYTQKRQKKYPYNPTHRKTILGVRSGGRLDILLPHPPFDEGGYGTDQGDRPGEPDKATGFLHAAPDVREDAYQEQDPKEAGQIDRVAQTPWHVLPPNTNAWY